MLPLKDDNPTLRPAVLTVLLILVNVAVFLVAQHGASPEFASESTAFNYEHAAIPCELTQGQPLTQDEVIATIRFGDDEACGAGSPTSPEVFPAKHVLLSALTSMFLHGGWSHIGFNMLFLWVFGNNIEDHLGYVRYLVFYAVAGVVATATHVLVSPDATVPLIGASGAIAGVMGAYLVWFPRAPILTLLAFFPIRVPAAALLVIWFLLQFQTSANEGVAWLAHVGGFVFGMAFAWSVKSSPGLRRAMWRRPYATAPWA